jgi:hypothetical protein
MSVPHVLPPHMWKISYGRARWLQHLMARALSQKQTERDAWFDHLSKPPYLTPSHAQVVRPCATWRTTRYPYNSGGLRSSNVWSGEPGSMSCDHGTKNWSHLGKIFSSTNRARSRSKSSKASNALWTQRMTPIALSTKVGTTWWKI